MNQATRGGCSRTRPSFFITKGTKGSKGTKTLRVLVVLGLLAGAGCTAKPPLANTFNTPEAVAGAVLEAIQRGDRSRLQALALSEDEFKNHVWPDLPAARPERNLPMSYVWGDLQQKSNQQLTATLRNHAGRHYELRAVTFADVTRYSHFRVHRQATFRVREPGGEQTDLRVSGSMIELDGIWKVFSYVVD